MIDIKELTYTYSSQSEPAIVDINLSIKKGELVLVIGPTGSGKSTLLYCLNGLIPHVLGGNLSGQIEINSLFPKEAPLSEISKSVGTVFQNPETQIFMLRVEDDVSFGCENLLMSREEIIARRDNALKEIGLWDIKEKETYKLSGGQKQRLAIGGVYAMGPEVFIFDEPTADLDEQGRHSFHKILRKLKDEKKTIVILEHQYEDILPLADRVVEMDKGRIVSGRQKHASAICEKKKKLWPERLVQLNKVCFEYESKKPVLHDIDLSFQKGEMVALCGHNGSGKTTLLKILAGILKPQNGKTVILNQENPGMEKLIGRVGFLFQNHDEQLFTDSVAEEVAFGPKQLKKIVDVSPYLELVGFTNLKGQHPQTLSRGQRQLLAFISILAMDPEIFILDEPTTGMDDGHWRRLMEMLQDLAINGKTVIFTTHRRNTKYYANRIVYLERGRIISDEIFG